MKPLEGVTILEFSTMITASFAAMMMGEQGARVIKVEPMEVGDPLRQLGTRKNDMAGLFASANRGKQSVRMNLKDEAAQQIVRDMVRDVDVVMHNYRPGVMDKLNLGSDALRAINPRLINIAISGFGKEGPLGNAPAYDPVIQASAGFAAMQGGDESPEFVKNLMCDKLTAYTACQAVTAALFHRERTGEGQHIDLSMLDSGLFFLFPDAFMNHVLLDDDREIQPLLGDLLYEITRTKDGGLTISASTDRQRAGVMVALGMEHLMADERFNSLEKLLANIEEYRALLEAEFLKLTTEEAMARLQANDVPVAACLSRDEVLAHPQLAANQSIEVQQHPQAGAIRVMKTPARFGGQVLPPGDPAPAHGQHTDEVLAGFGVSAEQLLALKAAGTLG